MALTTVTWTGNAGDNLWGTGENWAGGNVPGGNNAAFITGSLPYTVIVSAPTSVANTRISPASGDIGLEVNDANAILQIGTAGTAGVTLTVGNQLSVYKPLVEVDAGTIQTVNGGILSTASGNLNQTGGTIDIANSGTVSVGGALTQTGGTIVLSSGSLGVTGTFTENGGAIDITGGVATVGSISAVLGHHRDPGRLADRYRHAQPVRRLHRPG